MDDKAVNCRSCKEFKRCRDSAASWVFLFIGLIATIAIRLVNLVIDYGQFWAKLFWYIGVVGFLVYFLYKFRQDRAVQNELKNLKLADKLLLKEKLSDTDYEFLKTAVCRLKSNKDTINYFFIFFTSAIALILGVVQDFF